LTVTLSIITFTINARTVTKKITPPFSTLFLLVLMVALEPGPFQSARAQDSPSQTSISFDDAVRIALDRNVELKKALNQVGMQQANVSSSRADFFPSLNLTARPSRSWGLTFDQTTLNLVTQRSDFLSLGANAGVTVFDGFGNIASYRGAKYQLESDLLSLDRQEQTVFFSVIQTYLQVRRSDNSWSRSKSSCVWAQGRSVISTNSKRRRRTASCNCWTQSDLSSSVRYD
jgi:hypothetical protein